MPAEFVNARQALNALGAAPEGYWLELNPGEWVSGTFASGAKFGEQIHSLCGSTIRDPDEVT